MATTDELKANNYTCMVTLSVTVNHARRDVFSFSSNFFFEPGTDRMDVIKHVVEAALESARLPLTSKYSIQFFYMDKAFLGF